MAQNKHDHPSVCVHAALIYCPKCDVVHCENCTAEWGTAPIRVPFIVPMNPGNRRELAPWIGLAGVPEQKPARTQFVCEHH